jgi:plasminogen activator inhibitor 1 RNA-binding protein
VPRGPFADPLHRTGNDDGDSDTPKGPVKTVDKASTHTTKRNTDGAAPATRAPATAGARRGGAPTGNDGGMS